MSFRLKNTLRKQSGRRKLLHLVTAESFCLNSQVTRLQSRFKIKWKTWWSQPCKLPQVCYPSSIFETGRDNFWKDYFLHLFINIIPLSLFGFAFSKIKAQMLRSGAILYCSFLDSHNLPQEDPPTWIWVWLHNFLCHVCQAKWHAHHATYKRLIVTANHLLEGGVAFSVGVVIRRDPSNPHTNFYWHWVLSSWFFSPSKLSAIFNGSVCEIPKIANLSFI